MEQIKKLMEYFKVFMKIFGSLNYMLLYCKYKSINKIKYGKNERSLFTRQAKTTKSY